MNANGSPTGFGELMSPLGISILLVAVFFLIAAINLGSTWVKSGEIRARAERKKLKEDLDRQQREASAGLSETRGSGV